MATASVLTSGWFDIMNGPDMMLKIHEYARDYEEYLLSSNLWVAISNDKQLAEGFIRWLRLRCEIKKDELEDARWEGERLRDQLRAKQSLIDRLEGRGTGG